MVIQEIARRRCSRGRTISGIGFSSAVALRIFSSFSCKLRHTLWRVTQAEICVCYSRRCESILMIGCRHRSSGRHMNHVLLFPLQSCRRSSDLTRALKWILFRRSGSIVAIATELHLFLISFLQTSLNSLEGGSKMACVVVVAGALSHVCTKEAGSALVDCILFLAMAAYKSGAISRRASPAEELKDKDLVRLSTNCFHVAHVSLYYSSIAECSHPAAELSDENLVHLVCLCCRTILHAY